MSIIKRNKESLLDFEITIKVIWILRLFFCIIFFVSLFLGVYLYSEQYSVKEVNKKEFDLFYNSNIKGKIELLRKEKKFIFKTEGIDNTYSIYMERALDKKGSSVSIIQIGDSIIKPSRSDVVTIKKQQTGEVFYFPIDEDWRKKWVDYIPNNK
jgi:hypothetical protein